jgi:hypothetical protein
MLRHSWFLMLALVAFAALAMASTDPTADQGFPTGSVLLSPEGHVLPRSTLDDPQPDIFYYDPDTQDGIYYNYTNQWLYTRFTSPGRFSLVSVFFYIGCPTGGCGAAPCSVFVYLPNAAGRPGTQLTAQAVDLIADQYQDVNLPDTLEFAPNQDFLLVVGRAPDPTTGWYPLCNSGTTWFRSFTTRSNGTKTGTYYAVNNDWRFVVGGVLSDECTDIQMKGCWAETAPGVSAFHVADGSEVTLKAQVLNTGHMDIPSYTVDWTLSGPSSESYTIQATGTTIAAGESQIINAPEAYLPQHTGVYTLRAVVHADADSFAANDSLKARMTVGSYPMWLRYDDNATALDDASPLDGIGVSFKPMSFPAKIDTLRVLVYVPTGGTGSVMLDIYRNGTDGIPMGDPLWSGAISNPRSAWNSLAVSPPVNLAAGPAGFTVLYTSSGSVYLGRDKDLPNDMMMQAADTLAWEYSGGTWTGYPIGNWCLQSKVSVGVLPAMISTSADTLFFGSCDTTGHANVTRTVWIRNAEGASQNLEVTGIRILPSTPVVYSATPTTLDIAPGDSASMDVTFDPTSSRAYNYTLRLSNNSANDTAKVVYLRGTGIAQAVEIPSVNLPTKYSLAQNFPNPFNPTTEIRFALPTASHVRLSIYNMLGQEIATLVNEIMPAGTYAQSFDATNLPAGIYFYRMDAGSFTDVRKMMLLK